MENKVNEDFFGEPISSYGEGKSVDQLNKHLKLTQEVVNEKLESIDQKLEWLTKKEDFPEIHKEVVTMYKMNLKLQDEILSNVNKVLVQLIKKVMSG